MEILNLIDKETLSKLPLIFQTLKATSIEKSNKKHDDKYIKIDFYQTSKFTPYPHYKPISKIFKIHGNKPK
jgi:hypothetical protein